MIHLVSKADTGGQEPDAKAPLLQRLPSRLVGKIMLRELTRLDIGLFPACEGELARRRAAGMSEDDRRFGPAEIELSAEDHQTAATWRALVSVPRSTVTFWRGFGLKLCYEARMFIVVPIQGDALEISLFPEDCIALVDGAEGALNWVSGSLAVGAKTAGALAAFGLPSIDLARLRAVESSLRAELGLPPMKPVDIQC
ncbi:MAG TPA: hypothetical protein PKZ76_13575 [Xanthomonadaceae bacterium]|nr:hypothetical protein [Xanthomonadaceae bacterium]